MRIEQRRSLRVRVDLPARYRSGTLSLDGRARDLSQAGIFFVGFAGGEIESATGEVFLELDLPDEPMRPLSVVGEVRRASGHGMGIRFVGLPVADRRRLANYLIYLSHRASG
jgi:hypothetical protein